MTEIEDVIFHHDGRPAASSTPRSTPAADQRFPGQWESEVALPYTIARAEAREKKNFFFWGYGVSNTYA